jgi:hypothetical protein
VGVDKKTRTTCIIWRTRKKEIKKTEYDTTIWKKYQRAKNEYQRAKDRKQIIIAASFTVIPFLLVVILLQPSLTPDQSGTQYSFLKAWGTSGNREGELNHTTGVAVDSQGRYVYVADSHNNRVQKFDSNGVFVTSWGTYGSDERQFVRPYSIAVDSNGIVYIGDLKDDRIKMWAPSIS